MSIFAQNLKVSHNGKYLENSNGEPFLWLGDTAWELFHKLDREEAVDYLKNRAEKGFSVIQCVVLAENDGLRTPNPYGDIPLIDLDPAKPNEKYFEHVDFIVEQAEALGLFIGMLPTWGDKIWSLQPGAGPIVFNEQNAEVFGSFLGNRYRNKPVIWILGGDRNIDTMEVLDIWRSMAKGIREGDNGAHLITYHPRGGASSSYWLHNEEWLDFNMYQSGHAKRFNNVHEFAQRDILLHPRKPVIDGEPAYEDMAIRFWEYCDWTDPLRVPVEVLDKDKLIKDKSYFKEGFFNDHDVRIHAYWNLLSGACGYTYGNNAVWQMFKKGGQIAIPALYDWKESLDRPGADDIRHIKFIFEKYSLDKIVPDQSVIFGPDLSGGKSLRSASSSDSSFILIYSPSGESLSVRTAKINSDSINVKWFNPRNGEILPRGDYENKSIMKFEVPSNENSLDWLLIIEKSD
jgi:hypothetical protein